MNFLQIFVIVVVSSACVGFCAVDANWAGLTTEGREEEPVTSGKCGANVNWTFDNATHTLSLSGSGDMKSFSYTLDDPPPWVHLRSLIERVVMSEGITSIGYESFSGCSNLKSINIPDTVNKIESSSFHKCSSLESIKIPGNVRTIGTAAFQYCNLKSIKIPDSVTSIGRWAFGYCPLTTVEIPRGVTSIASSTFQKCTKLESVTIPDTVTFIGSNAFWGCSSLTSLIIPKNVSTIENSALYVMFGNLKNLGFLGTKDPQPSQTVLFEPNSVTVCVPDEYNSSRFCGAPVTKNSTICGAIFNQNGCNKAVFHMEMKQWILNKSDDKCVSRSDRIQTITILSYMMAFIFTIVLLP